MWEEHWDTDEAEVGTTGGVGVASGGGEGVGA